MNLKNYLDIIVITGTSSGLGKELAIQLCNEDVVILGISRNKSYINSNNFQEELIDISDYKYAEKCMIKYWNQKLNRDLKIGIVLCAGTLGNSGGLLNSNLEDWEKTYATNVLGNLAILKGTLPNMIQNKFGRIIFISGGGAAYGYPLFSGYALSKTAIVREAENLAIELKNKGNFSTIVLASGAMKTPMLEKVLNVGGEVKTTVDIQEPIEFCKAFLESDNAYRLNGNFIHVRDNWKKYLEDDIPVEIGKWLLRRTE